MQLFGQFCLIRGGIVLDEEILHSNKLTKLLIYMIFNRNREIPFQEIIDLFWEGNTKNPQNALKNLMYRLRSAMKALGEEEFITTLPGAYRWNQEIQVETDYEYFENLALEIRKEEDVQKRKSLCKTAIASYNRHISEKISSESWILSKQVWYRSLFIDVVKELGKIYEEEGDWSKLEMLCNGAVEVDSGEEELHYWMIESLWKQNKTDLAMEHYENISKILYDAMGIHTSERLQSIFKEIMETENAQIKDIEYLFSQVEEPQIPQGAFFCDYQNFRQIYRMEARRNHRLGMEEHVLMLTLRRSGGIRRNPGADSGLAEGMLLLENKLKNFLRKGDVVTRYSLTQYIVLLPACDFESGIAVAERIKKMFYKGIGNKHLELNYELKPVKVQK